MTIMGDKNSHLPPDGSRTGIMNRMKGSSQEQLLAALRLALAMPQLDESELRSWFAATEDTDLAMASVKSAPDVASALHEFGCHLWGEAGRELLALDVFRGAVRQGSRDALSTLGDALNWFGAHEEAVDVLRQALAVETENSARIAGLLGQSLYAVHHDDSEVEDLLRRGAEAHDDFKLDYAQLLRRRGSFSHARQILEQLTDRGVFGAAIVLGNLLDDDLGDEDAAVAAYRLGIKSGDSHSAYNLGVLYLRRGDRAEAERFFRLARQMGDLKDGPSDDNRGEDYEYV